jgi:hypothetical protein
LRTPLKNRREDEEKRRERPADLDGDHKKLFCTLVTSTYFLYKGIWFLILGRDSDTF